LGTESSLECSHHRSHWLIAVQLGIQQGPFSQATGAGPIIGALAFVVIIVIVLWLRRNAQGLAVVAAGLIVGGATGNLIDRLLRGDAWLRGAVVDFIDLQWWPIFNIADAAISTGAVLMIVASVRASKSTS